MENGQKNNRYVSMKMSDRSIAAGFSALCQRWN